MNPQEIIFIVGPTAVGKSDVALMVAREINAEIISCDAMQVYKEIAIANNRPTASMLKQVPHHLIDIVSVEQEFDVVTFNRLALQAIENIHRRKKMPLIVGGSGMYMQILLDGIFAGGGKDLATRKSLEERIGNEGSDVLYAELKKVDPSAAVKIHPNDAKRIVRALEVYLTTKKTISELRPVRSGLWGKYDIDLYGLDRARVEVYALVDRRVDQMIDEGLIDEIKKLSGLNLSPTAQRIIGVAEIRGYLKGEYDLEQAKYLMKLHTRHLAKRQWTWFRKEKRLKWLTISPLENQRELVGKILAE